MEFGCRKGHGEMGSGLGAPPAQIGIEIEIETGVVLSCSCIPECKEVQRVQGAIGADAPQHLRFGRGSGRGSLPLTDLHFIQNDREGEKEKRNAGYILIAHRAIPPPLNPLNLLNPFPS